MAKKQYFIIIDTETTMENTVVDFGAVVVDRKGNILNQCAVIVRDTYKKHELFHNEDSADLWKKENLNKRYSIYDNMLDNGSRMLASVNAINAWLAKVNGKYNPVLTAYNLAFDVDKMRKTGIDCDMFSKSFCLWQTSASHIANKKDYKQFCLENHYFTNRTKYGNMTIKTNAEVMTHYLMGNDVPEPHTAIEDILDYELPTLVYLLKRKTLKQIMEYDFTGWRDLQVKDFFKAK